MSRSGKRWYVIRVESGKEEKTLLFMDVIIDLAPLGRAFIPKVTRKRKYRDGWREMYLPFVPGYIFFETDDPMSLFFELKKVPQMTLLLRMDEDMLAVSRKEEAFIKSFLGEDDVVAVSVAHKEGDKVVIDKGPLTGREAMIKKIYPHKRKAVISTEMFGRTIELTLGLEILSSERIDEAPQEARPDPVVKLRNELREGGNWREPLWETVRHYQGHTFRTSGRGKEHSGSVGFTYRIRTSSRTGHETGELEFSTREQGKTVTRSSVELALSKGMELMESAGCVSGPKKLGVFGASYLYAMFLEWGLIKKGDKNVHR